MALRQGNFVRTTDISLPPSLHNRLKAVCKREGLKIIELIRNATAERVEALEKKHREEDERRKAEREVHTKFTGFRRMSTSTLVPPPKPTPLGEKPAPEEKPPAAQEAASAYVQHAEKIYAALHRGSALEARLCTIEAISALKKSFPITHPPDNEIAIMLEDLVLAMRKNAEAETVIDASKVKTFGDVTPDNEAP